MKDCATCGGKMPCSEHTKTGKVAGDLAKTMTKFKGEKKGK